MKEVITVHGVEVSVNLVRIYGGYEYSIPRKYNALTGYIRGTVQDALQEVKNHAEEMIHPDYVVEG